MFKIILVAALFGVVFSANSDKIDSSLAKKFETKTTENVIVSFVGGNSIIVSKFETKSFKTREQKLKSLTSSLKNHAEVSQQNVVSYLKSKSVSHKSFWISNQIFIPNANEQLVKSIAAYPEVETIKKERIIQLETPKISSTILKKADNQTSKLADVEWNLEKINVPEAWEITNGSGIILGNIDSGVRYTHEALRDNYRFDHSWRDPYYNAPTPNDPLGHGTHTMGTAVGTINGIGVAPGAKWIACRGCSNEGTCNQQSLTACGEWVMCPDPDCTQAPNVVSNSWGGGSRGSDWYAPITNAWITGGIIPVFSIGNSGSSCGSVSSPGDNRRVIGVGSTNEMDEVSSFSGVGPSIDGRIKPDLTAPGEEIVSAYSESDSIYAISSGTSMACPHVSGITALILSVNPNLIFAQVRNILLASVDTDVASEGRVCDSVADTTFPNHRFGFGRINALKAVHSAKATLKQ